MEWHDRLTGEQRLAASSDGVNVRLLAGPGTGKTLVMTRRILYLIQERNVLATNILPLTFTRAAAFELRRRVKESLSNTQVLPNVSTLHSFALRQLLRNWDKVRIIPEPLRIADDWEERRIIAEDIKRMLRLNQVDDAERKFEQLSTDWQTLDAEQEDWEKRFPDPKFLGAWQEHRRIYGYLIRAELVYRLRRALEDYKADFDLDGPPPYTLVDEYQDLNRCDLAVIKAIEERGSRLFAAGDDDQSIYGFRGAHPDGIRRFAQFYPNATLLELTLCKRCDPAILALGIYVAEQDYRREPKELLPESNRDSGEVHILRFSDQDEEARGVAELVSYLLRAKNYEPEDILVLLRSDARRAFSSVLADAIANAGLQVAAKTGPGPLDSEDGRKLLALLRLCVNPNDHLAWRTLLQLRRRNGVGPGAIDAIYEVARQRGTTFYSALSIIAEQPSLEHRHGRNISKEFAPIETLRQTFENQLGESTDISSPETLAQGVRNVAEVLIPDGPTRNKVMAEIERAIEYADASELRQLFRALEAVSDDIEQEIERGKVNILTMHKAKGLTAKAVIIVAAEGKLIPHWRAVTSNEIDNELRLLYVSLTRAEHDLFITYCTNRYGQQNFSGGPSRGLDRQLTRFLKDGPVPTESGAAFVKWLVSTIAV